MSTKYYAVKIGKATGIYESWDECKSQVDGFAGAKYKSFKTIEEARIYLNDEENKQNSLNTACKENISITEECGLADIEKNPIIGTDESGKGDFFGPLVIAGVYADEKMKKILRELGVDDSKKLTDSKISVIATQIKVLCEYETVVIGNSRYNELYNKFGNLNKLLAWGHARVIENILSKVKCNIVLSDQFGNENLIKNALINKGKRVHLEQRHRAEENVVVAAASILARNEYVERINSLSKKYQVEFPKGASKKTIETGKNFVQVYGRDKLSEVSKIHFKTTTQI